MEATRSSPRAVLARATVVACFCWALTGAFVLPLAALELLTLHRASPAEIGAAWAAACLAGLVAAGPVRAAAARRPVATGVGCAFVGAACALIVRVGPSFAWASGALVVGGAVAVGASALVTGSVRNRAESRDAGSAATLAAVVGPPVASFVAARFGPAHVLTLTSLTALVAGAATLVAARWGTGFATRPPIHATDAADAADATDATDATDGTRRATDRRGAPGRSPATTPRAPGPDEAPDAGLAGRRRGVNRLATTLPAAVLLAAVSWVAVGATALLVTQRLGWNGLWAGVAVGVTAGLLRPAASLAVLAARRSSPNRVLAAAGIVGAAAHATVVVAGSPVPLLAAQAAHAFVAATVVAVGVPAFMRPRSASAAQTRSATTAVVLVGGTLAGGIVAVASGAEFGYGGTFLASAVVALVATGLAAVGALTAP